MSVDRILMVGDDGALVCDVLLDDDDQEAAGVPLMQMVNDWYLSEQLDGELHPYLDESLWVLKGFNDAAIHIVEQFEADDPHRGALLELYRLAEAYVNKFLVALNGEAT